MSSKNKKKKSGRNLVYLFVVLGILILDQITKLFIRINLNQNESFPLIKNILHFTYITNTGAGFSIMQNSNILLMFFSLFVFGIILFFWQNIKNNERLPFALVLGGILGNVSDRIFLGAVVDFIDFRIWPAFNFADSAIFIGVLILIINEIQKKN